MEKDRQTSRKNWLGSALIAVGGWFVCAAMCLFLTIELEGWPRAYDFVLPAAVAVLFSNVLVFIFTASRHGENVGKLFRAVCRICVTEGLLFFVLFLWGRFFIGA